MRAGSPIETHIAVLSETGPGRSATELGTRTGQLYPVLYHRKAAGVQYFGAEYPYVIDDFFSLRGTSTGGVNDDNWYYFYDWKVEFTEPCGRTGIDLEVTEGDAPTANFSPSVDTFSIDNNAPVLFENTSEMRNHSSGILTMVDLGRGFAGASVRGARNLYCEPHGHSADGCTDATLHTIVVEEATLSSTEEAAAPALPYSDLVAVFPNPSLTV